MNKDNLEKLITTSAKNKKAYKLFQENGTIDLLAKNNINIKKTFWNGKESKSSLQFEEKELKTLFNVNEDHFRQATHDTQGLETTRIRTLHSSALLGLLAFDKVSDKNSIKFDDAKLKNIEFTDVEFEHGNPISKSSIPSQIDVCLRDNNKNRRNVLFLESKFTEPLSGGNQTDIKADVYRTEFEQFNDIFFSPNLMRLTDIHTNKKGSEVFDLVWNGENPSQYCQGIKQMICHYLGARNYARYHEGENVYLGTILFRFPECIDKRNRIDSYANLYTKLAETMNLMLEKSSYCINLHVLENPIYYDEVFDKNGYELNDNIRTFYQKQYFHKML